MTPTRWLVLVFAVTVWFRALGACSSDSDTGTTADVDDLSPDPIDELDGATDLREDGAADLREDGAFEDDGDVETPDAEGDSFADVDLGDASEPDVSDIEANCTSHLECIGDPEGEVCDFESGDCVECTNDDHCVDNPDGWRCAPDNQCITVEGCIRHSDCAGHPSGELCIFFEERCGECLDNDDCLETEGCSSDFTCNDLTDDLCATEDDDLPYVFEEQCVECRIDDHCDGIFRTLCSDDNRCVECRLNEHCTSEDEAYCDDGICGECSANEHCTETEFPYCIAGRCRGCDPALCPSETPFCDWTECAECTRHGQCDRDADIYCNDNVCVLEDIPCDNNRDCSDHSTLDHCASWNRCVECTATSHCLLGGLFGYEVCDVATGACVTCADDDDCDNEDYPYCSDSNRCGECATDDNCVGDPGGPVCGRNGYCNDCRTNDDCAGHPNGDYCVDGWRCGECLNEDHCTGDDVCEDGRCVCSARYDRCFLDMATYVCGTYADNCEGRFSCGECGDAGTCVDGGRDCDCPPDVLDDTSPNDSVSNASNLPDMSDAPPSSINLVDLSVHSVTDEDWYTVHVEDDADFGNPDVYLTLTVEAPESAAGDLDDRSTYEVTMWVQCDNGRDSSNSTCSGRLSDETALGIGCYVTADSSYPRELSAKFNCAGTLNDSGVVTIRVRKTERFGRCDSYQLELVAD